MAKKRIVSNLTGKWWMMDALLPLWKFSSRARLMGFSVPALLLAIFATSYFGEARAELMAPRHASLEFPRPASIEPNVKFWVDVFTSYSVRDFVVLDKDHVWRIFQVLHIPGEGSPTSADVQWANTYLKTKYADILNRLATGHQPASYEEQRVAELFKDERNPDYLSAAQNLRVQQGMAENFRKTLVRAQLYLPQIEQVFSSMGLPTGLALIPTVESGFHPYVRSKCGATGLWQFTRATGKEYMTVSGREDDRLNPVKATQAAAELLQHNHELLGDWPLAITAYNYGTGGMMQAVEATGGGDYCQILRRWDGPRFGFASKNYYSEFLAALQVYQYREAYFPGINQEVPDLYEPPPPVEHARYVPRSYHSHASVRRVIYSSSRGSRHHMHHAVYHSRSRHHLRTARADTQMLMARG